jgi:hypothetical protein
MLVLSFPTLTSPQFLALVSGSGCSNSFNLESPGSRVGDDGFWIRVDNGKIPTKVPKVSQDFSQTSMGVAWVSSPTRMGFLLSPSVSMWRKDRTRHGAIVMLIYNVAQIVGEESARGLLSGRAFRNPLKHPAQHI